MNENLKFRKWDKESKTMIKVEVLDLGQTYKDNPVIMQSTGLKDINSKEIYEGDILSLPTHYRIIMPDVDHWVDDFWVDDFLEVKYSSWFGGFIVSPSEKYLSEYLFNGCDKNGFYHKYPKIIGNIYQNPELINMIEKENE